MQMKRFPIILLAALFIIGLAACTRPASRPPTELATPTTAEGGFPLPGTSDVMGQLEVFATQTAIALQGGTPQATQPPAQETPAEGTPEGGETTGGETPVAQTTPPAETVPAAETPAAATEAPTSEATEPPQPAAPTNTAVPIPPATPGLPTSYTLRGGEFPYCIARRFNVDPGELLRANGLGPNSATSPGTTLQIPQSGSSFPGQRALKAHPTTYIVQAGDSVYSIACQYGDVDPNNIILANGLNGAGDISVGQTLQIP